MEKAEVSPPSSVVVAVTNWPEATTAGMLSAKLA